MKGNKKILVVAALLLLITVSFATYAIYRESGTVTGTLTAAAWHVEVGGQAIASTTYTFDMDDVIWTTKTGYNDTIAPGSVGYIDIPVDATGSEVDVIFEAEVAALASKPTGLTVEAAGTGETFIPYSASDMSGNVRINVTWEGAESDDSTKDANDLSFEGDDFSVTVNLTARQSLEGHS